MAGMINGSMEHYRTMTGMITWNTNGQWIICSWGRDKRVTRQYEKWTIYRCFITYIYIQYIFKYILKMLVFHSYSKIQFPEGSWSLPDIAGRFQVQQWYIGQPHAGDLLNRLGKWNTHRRSNQEDVPSNNWRWQGNISRSGKRAANWGRSAATKKHTQGDSAWFRKII